jgi:tetrahydrodipicolinate N-succinyltransferase
MRGAIDDNRGNAVLPDAAVRLRGYIAANATPHPATTNRTAIVAASVMSDSIASSSPSDFESSTI